MITPERLEAIKAQIEKHSTPQDNIILCLIDEVERLQSKIEGLKKDNETLPTIFKFHYYPTKGYACSHSGDNTGYYVNLNDYERLKSENQKLKDALLSEANFMTEYGIALQNDTLELLGEIGSSKE